MRVKDLVAKLQTCDQEVIVIKDDYDAPYQELVAVYELRDAVLVVGQDCTLTHYEIGGNLK